ncbi:hypothetical protein K523DRAFT_104639 [Schizophyllum commune Tattone D]|nr:hypothetical protein K523DRAFT_104639 [Schizophyllum commune Tattone D]
MASGPAAAGKGATTQNSTAAGAPATQQSTPSAGGNATTQSAAPDKARRLTLLAFGLTAIALPVQFFAFRGGREAVLGRPKGRRITGCS